MTKSKHSKGKTKGANRVKAAERRADEILSRIFTPLYALEDFGSNARKTPNDFFALQEAVSGICNKGRLTCEDAAKKLPNQHPALPHLSKACAALDALNQFMKMAQYHSEADSAKPARSFLAMVGRGIVSFTGECGRYCERAEHALGGFPTVGFLNGYLLDGGDMKQTTEDEYILLRRFRGLEERRQATVGVMVAELEKQQASARHA